MALPLRQPLQPEATSITSQMTGVTECCAWAFRPEALAAKAQSVLTWLAAARPGLSE